MINAKSLFAIAFLSFTSINAQANEALTVDVADLHATINAQLTEDMMTIQQEENQEVFEIVSSTNDEEAKHNQTELAD